MTDLVLWQISVWITGMVYIRRHGVTPGMAPDWVAIALWQPILVIYSLMQLRDTLRIWSSRG